MLNNRKDSVEVNTTDKVETKPVYDGLFRVIDGATINTDGGLSKNPVEQAYKTKDEINNKDDKSVWFIKVMKQAAIYEILTQEFFRLIIPTHPKTRIYKLPDNRFLIASKAVPNFESILKIFKTQGGDFIVENTLNHTFEDLGKVTLVALAISENDLKSANIGVADNHYIKLDGDEGLIRFRTTDNGEDNPLFTITQENLASLPRVQNYPANNWFDSCINGHSNPDKPTIFNEDLRTPDFIREENEGILSILVLSDKLLEEFVRSYLSFNEKLVTLFTGYFITIRNNLLEEAMKNKDFLDYVASGKAASFLPQYIEQLEKFKTTGKNYLKDKVDNLKINITDEFDALKSKMLPIEISKICVAPKEVESTQDTTPPRSPSSGLFKRKSIDSTDGEGTPKEKHIKPSFIS